MRIVIDPFDVKSVDAAISQIKQYEKDFAAKETEFVRRLKELGVSVARTGYATADYDGVNDVLITETQRGGNAMIIAYGQAVGFIEFGTGVRFRDTTRQQASSLPRLTVATARVEVKIRMVGGLSRVMVQQRVTPTVIHQPKRCSLQETLWLSK